MAEPTEEQAQSGASDPNGLRISDLRTTVTEETQEVAEETGNKFQQAIAAWRALNLTELVSSLDAAASELVSQQKDSMVQRKELAQKTKDFRKLDDTSKLAQVKDLLKAYQTYIDVLTNHNKTINSAFMQAYSPLSEAPDPYPLLEASVDSQLTTEEVLPKLQSDNEALQKQVARMNGQLEESEQQLEAERAKRQSFEGTQDTKIKEVEESWSAVLKEKEDNWTAKEKSLEEKVENQDRLLKELKASYEVSQRLGKSGEESQDIGRSSATAAELEIVSSELEKANIRLADVEARNEQLRVDLAQTASQANSSNRSANVEDDPAFLRLRSENSSLLRRLDTVRYEKDAEKTGLHSKLRGVEREIESLTADRDALQGKVRKWNDYEDVKRELDMLRAIEFASVAEGDIGDDEDELLTSNGAPGKKQAESLEKLLLARNKKLSNEFTELRVAHNELQQQLSQLQEDLSSTNMDLEKARELNAILENDVQKAQQHASNAFDNMSVAGTYTTRHAKSTYGGRRGGIPSPTSSIIGGFDAGSGSGSPRALESLRAGEAVGGGSGILPMVTAQRDRFKKKIGELEQELQKQYQAVTSLRSEVASLQKDNLNLYEKTRYVSSYSRGGGSATATSGSSYGYNPNPSAISVGGGTEDRYRSAYESNISPFAAFRGRESARALKRMSLPERAIFQITRMVLATRTSRNLFALYCCGLHILILMMLYWWTTADLEAHASGLGLTSAMVGNVGGAGAAGGSGGYGGLADDQSDWVKSGFEGKT